MALQRVRDLVAAAVVPVTRTRAFGSVVAGLDRFARDDPHNLAVLLYHRVTTPDGLDPALVSATPDEFACQMELLTRTRNVVSLEDVLAARRDSGLVTRGAVLLTFDDAYRDFAENAWPVLARHGLPATLFVPTSYAGESSQPFWWDRLYAALHAAHGAAVVRTPLGEQSLRSAHDRSNAMRALRTHVTSLPHDDAMRVVEEVVRQLGEPTLSRAVLRWDELRALAAEGVTLAPHTRTHPRLDRLAPDDAREEILGSFADLEREVGAAPPAFAFPGGGRTDALAPVLDEAGVEVAFTTKRGRSDLRASDWLALRRTNVGRRTSVPLLRAQLLAPPRRAPAPPSPRTADFDVHGLARVRLLDALPGEIDAVARQLGPLTARVEGEADIAIRFVERLEVGRPLTLLGLGDAAFTDDAFLVLRGARKARARVAIPLDRVGERIEITCERGVAAVPLLVPILNLTILARGALPLHGSAFEFDGCGVVATGWSKGGKTELLLGAVAHGARYVGDEWVYVSSDGARVHGLPEPIRVWDWHLADAPAYRRAVSRSERMRLRAFASTERAAARISSRAGAAVARQRGTDVPPAELFGERFSTQGTSFDRLLFVASHDSREIVLEEVDPLEVAERVPFSLRHERAGLLAYYDKFRFAFPDAANPLVEQAHELERSLTRRVFAGKRAFALRHPYPVALEPLARAALDVLEDV